MSLKQRLRCDTLGCKMGFTVKGIVRMLEQKFTRQNIALTIEQFFLLNILDSEQGLIVQDLSEILDRDKSAVVRHLNGLEEKRFVTRTTDPDDKRRKIIVITKPGIQVLEKARDLAKQINNDITRHITDRDLKKFESVLSDIYERISSEEYC